MQILSRAHLASGLLAQNTLDSPILKSTSGSIRRITYTPFGYARVCGIEFTGQTKEPALGSYLLGNGYRGYSPTLMRFVASDSFSPFGAGGMNSYAYGGASPTNGTDPTGHLFGNFSRWLFRIKKREILVVTKHNPKKDLISGLFSRESEAYYDASFRMKRANNKALLSYKGKHIYDDDLAIRKLDKAIKRDRELPDGAFLLDDDINAMQRLHDHLTGNDVRIQTEMRSSGIRLELYKPRTPSYIPQAGSLRLRGYQPGSLTNLRGRARSLP